MGYPMNIGEAAQAAGVTAKMIRHYEGLGLIAEASRTDAGYRQYTERDVNVLRFIRQSRAMGFPIKQIEQLLGMWADTHRQSREVKDLARAHIAELDRKMAEMARMKESLEQIAAACRGDERADCSILSGLSGDSAAHQSAAPVSKAPKERNRKTKRTEARQPECHQHAGLSAWMQGLRQAGTAEHAQAGVPGWIA
jgi:Cu(I)-responsive transcriptional regulator